MTPQLDRDPPPQALFIFFWIGGRCLTLEGKSGDSRTNKLDTCWIFGENNWLHW